MMSNKGSSNSTFRDQVEGSKNNNKLGIQICFLRMMFVLLSIAIFLCFCFVFKIYIPNQN